MNNKLKRRLILLLTIILLGWGWHYLTETRPWDLRIPVVDRTKKLPDYEFQVLSISEVSGDKVFYRVSADSLLLDNTQGLLEQVTGSILENNKPALNFTARNGVLEVAAKIFTFNDFYGQTIGRYKLPWTITAAQAIWHNKVQKFTFTPNPRLTNGEMNIVSSKIIYDLNLNTFSLEAGCEARTGEYTVHSEQAVLRQAVNLITMKNNVVLTGKDFKINANQLDWSIQDEQLFFQDGVQLQTKDITLVASAVSLNTKADLVYLQNDIRLQTLNTTQNILVNTNRALWNRQENKIEFYEGTRAWENNSLIESEQLIYDLQNNTLLTTGEGRTKIIKTDD